MRFADLKWCFPQCPVKSILQVGGEPMQHRMGGYGKKKYYEKEEDIFGTFDYIWVPELPVTNAMKLYLNVDGIIAFKNGEITNPCMVCIHQGEYKVYKRIK